MNGVVFAFCCANLRTVSLRPSVNNKDDDDDDEIIPQLHPRKLSYTTPAAAGAGVVGAICSALIAVFVSVFVFV